MDQSVIAAELQVVKEKLGSLQTRVDKLEQVIVPSTAANFAPIASLLEPWTAQHAAASGLQATNFATNSIVAPAESVQQSAASASQTAPAQKCSSDQTMFEPLQNSPRKATRRQSQNSSSPTRSGYLNRELDRQQTRVIFDSPQRVPYSISEGTASSKLPAKAEKQANRVPLEVAIGKHLNKVGISFFVLGCVFALMYQFQYFSPLLKILSGVLASIGLIAAGEYFEKKPSYQWYGRSLTGGGWALCYFAIFAAHNFDAVRVIESALLDFILLLGVAAAAVGHSLKYKSETITCIGLTLPFLTIAMSTVSSFSLIACALLVAALAAIVLKMRWYNLMLYGETIVYAIASFKVLPDIVANTQPILGLSSASAAFTIAAIFSTFCWAAFNFVIFIARYSTPAQRNYIICSTLLNTLAYIPTMLLLMQPIHPDWQYSFLLASAGAYALCAVSADRSKMPETMNVHLYIALTLFSLAIPFKLTADWFRALWCLETPLLIWTGLRYDMPVMRRFAAFLAGVIIILCAWDWLFTGIAFHNLVLGATALCAYTISAVFYSDFSPLRSEEMQARGKQAFHCYFALSSLFLLLTTANNVSSSWLPLAYLFDGAAILIAGFALADSVILNTGVLCIFLLAAPVYACGISHTTSLASALMIPILFYLSEKYKRLSPSGTVKRNTWVEYSLFGCATLVLIQLTDTVLAPSGLAQLAVTIEALVFLFVGLSGQDKRARIAAFLLCTWLTVHYFLIDSQSMDTVSILGLVMHKRILLAMWNCAGIGLAALAYTSKRYLNVLGQQTTAGFYSFGSLAAGIAVYATLMDVPAPWLALAFTLESTFTILLGYIKPQLRDLRSLGTLGLFFAQFSCLVLSLGRWSLHATVLLILVQVVMSLIYRKVQPENRTVLEQSIENCYGASATVTTALLLMQIIPTHWLTLGWTVESIVILTFGFRLADRALRMQGLLLLGVVISRLLFVELASLATIYRILSFIGAGIVLLAASFAFGNLGTRPEEDTGASKQRDLLAQ